jgi:hypothetical protein
MCQQSMQTSLITFLHAFSSFIITKGQKNTVCGKYLEPIVVQMPCQASLSATIIIFTINLSSLAK